MKALLERVKREPALLVGLVGAVIALLLAFGLELTVEQQGAIMALVVALLAVFTRSQVTPNVSVAAKEEDNTPRGDLVAGDASALPNDTSVDVVPAEDVYGKAGDLPPGHATVTNDTGEPEPLNGPRHASY